MSSIPSGSIAAISAATGTSPTGSGLPAATDPLANESTFLRLLVSQLQNQNPLNPTDSNQFISQLTSYSQLEQLIQIRQNTAPAPAVSPIPGTTKTG